MYQCAPHQPEAISSAKLQVFIGLLVETIFLEIVQPAKEYQIFKLEQNTEEQ